MLDCHAILAAILHAFYGAAVKRAITPPPLRQMLCLRDAAMMMPALLPFEPLPGYAYASAIALPRR